MHPRFDLLDTGLGYDHYDNDIDYSLYLFGDWACVQCNTSHLGS